MEQQERERKKKAETWSRQEKNEWRCKKRRISSCWWFVWQIHRWQKGRNHSPKKYNLNASRLYLSRIQEYNTSAKTKQKPARMHLREDACSPDLELSCKSWCIFPWQPLPCFPSSVWKISLPLCKVQVCTGAGGTSDRQIFKLPVQSFLSSHCLHSLS